MVMLLAVLGHVAGLTATPQFFEVEDCLCPGRKGGCVSAPLLVNRLLGAFDFERGDGLDRTSRLTMEPAPVLEAGFKSDYGLMLLPKLHYRVALALPRPGRLTLGLWVNWHGGEEWTSLLWLEPAGLALRVGPDGALQLTGPGPTNNAKSLVARGRLVADRWSHLFLALSGKRVTLHLNGTKDVVLAGLAALQIDSLHLGRSATHNSTLVNVDDLYAWNKAVESPQRDLLDLGAFLPAMGATRLGCRSCDYHQALKECRAPFRLCSVQELYAFGYDAAAANGWLERGQAIWYFAGAAADDGARAKLGLCCRD